jgi:DNA-binding beta-propeller fold protein YncE
VAGVLARPGKKASGLGDQPNDRFAREAAMIKIQRRTLFSCLAFAAGIAALGIGQALLQQKAEAQGSSVTAPIFEVDPLWPKPLPNNWLLGWTIGAWVDDQDHVWIIHRGAGGLHNNERGAELTPPIAECCRTAPPILVFDQEGNLLRAWGGPGAGYEWPSSNHGVHIDYKGNVWIGGNGEKDSHLLKFTNDGKFLLQVGKPGNGGNSNDLENFGRVAKIWVDPKANEAYVADGYLNKRVAVLDADTGKMKRYWGAYGNKPDDTKLAAYDPSAPPAQQFRNPVHCVERSNDGLVYVCDRQNDRIQVFQPDGKFVKEGFYAKNTLGAGSAWDLAFSKDPLQRFIFLADGQNSRVRIIVRDTLEEITAFGDGGRQPGQFYGVHSIASDSKGNLYTTETYEGKRLQKFVYKGLGSVPRGYMGVLWPKR